MSVILVTHDLGVVADVCDRVAVMYAGQIVETAEVHSLFASPQHPYTAGLLSAVPSPTVADKRLASLPGRVPSLDSMPAGCRFAPRCEHARDVCHEHIPEIEQRLSHEVRCLRAHELSLDGVDTAAHT